MSAVREAKSDLSADDRLTRRVLAVCEAVGAFIEWWGFKAIHGRIWVLLALSRRPLTQIEVSQVLGVSRSLVSMAMAELGEYGLVRATSGKRQAPYQASMDVWSIITDVLRSREWMLVERTRTALVLAIAEAETQSCRGKNPLDFDLYRLRVLLHMTELAQALLRTLMALGQTKVPRGVVTWIRKAATLTTSLRYEDAH